MSHLPEFEPPRHRRPIRWRLAVLICCTLIGAVITIALVGTNTPADCCQPYPVPAVPGPPVIP